MSAGTAGSDRPAEFGDSSDFMLEDIPVHGIVLEADQWWACEHPERTATDQMAVDAACRGCVLALGAAAVSADGIAINGLGAYAGTFRTVYEAAREYHGLPPLPPREA